MSNVTLAFGDLPGLAPYATTERERSVLKAWQQAGSIASAAALLGMARADYRTVANRVISRARADGWTMPGELATDPKTWPANSSTLTRGTTDEGNVILQWDIRRQDKYQREEAVRQAIAGLLEDLPSEPNTPAPRLLDTAAEFANVYTITDAHIGALAWQKETGSAWDTTIGERVVTGTMTGAIRNGFEADTAYVVFLGDVMHYDSMKSLTPAHGHLLDGDTRYPRLAKAACRMAANVVRAAIAKHKQVKVVTVEGNHDEIGSGFWLGEVLEARFGENDRVKFLTGPRVIRADLFGANLLAWHHGHTVKPDQLQGAVSSEYRREWGLAARTYAHVGHRHSKWVPPARNGIQIVQHATLAGRDAYAARLAFDAERLATVYTYHKDVGEVASATWTPAMLGL